MEDWVGALIALVGVAIGAILSHVLTTRLTRDQRHWEEMRYRRNKLEELSAVLDLFEDSYRKLADSAAMRLNNGTPMTFSGERIPESQLNTLLSLYAPEMLEEKAVLDKLTADYGTVITEVFGCSNLDSAAKEELMHSVISGHHKIEEQCGKLALMTADIVRREVASEPFNEVPDLQETPAGEQQVGATLYVNRPDTCQNK